MAGLITTGQQYKTQAKQGLQQVASMETARKDAGEMMEAQEKQATMSAVGTGTAIGASVGGPPGALIGAGVGLVASKLF